MSVWGAEYIDLLSRVALPPLLTTGNLLGFAPYETELDIYTLKGEIPALHALPGLLSLSGFIDVRITEIAFDQTGADRFDARYKVMSAMHNLAIRRAAQKNAAIFFLAPDAVFADGSLGRARELLQDGKRLVLLPGARSSSQMRDVLLARYNPFGRVGMSIPPRELVANLVRYPYEQQWQFWGMERLTISPSHVYFRVKDEGFIIRGFHHHPVAVYPENWQSEEVGATTVDSTWCSEAVPDPSSVHLITDTDEGFVVDVATDKDNESHVGEVTSDPERHVIEWARTNTDARQRTFARENIFVHSGPLNANWGEVAATADDVYDRILARLTQEDESSLQATANR
ncbi:MAG: hypothetical protein ABSE64_14315 [Vulcanimicrobiaceae bacterium]|jgi:hypothetical protein